MSFDEMLSSKRYDVLWEPGKGVAAVRGMSYKICLTTTQMKKSFLVLTIQKAGATP